MAQLSKKVDDWCHICGRRQSNLADIRYPRNAEHSKNNTEYIRICQTCGELISQVAGDGDDGEEHST